MLFCSDLDNTMIYSYRRDIGKDKKCVELYKGRELSYMTYRSIELLKEVSDKVMVVPTTTRDINQYKRINLGIGSVPYALVCNGGVLLVDGEEDKAWYEASLISIQDCEKDIQLAKEILMSDANRSFEVRHIKELFLFTKSNAPQETVEHLKESVDVSLVDVSCIGTKVYVIPKKLSKGEGVRRLKAWLNRETMIAAGDSDIDVPMAHEATIGILPHTYKGHLDTGDHIVYMDAEGIFSEHILSYILKLVEQGEAVCKKNMLA